MIELETKISDIDLSLRTKHVLERAKITYVWQLMQCTEKELLRCPNFGRKNLNEVKEYAGAWQFYVGK
jgi:DNA-directed RNA polymerase alpha subunit